MLPFDLTDLDAKNIIVHGGVGSKEKSNYIKSQIAKYGAIRTKIVVVVFQVTLLAQETTRLRDETGLPFVSHNDIASNRIDLNDNPFVVVQYECLPRLLTDWNLGDDELILVCDEWNSILRQMESTTGPSTDTALMFQTLVKYSTHTLCMDASF